MPEHTIAENLTRLQTATAAIGNAITAKGGTVSSGDGLEDFASDIATIPSGGGDNNAKFVSNGSAFNMASLESIEIPDGVTTIDNNSFSSSIVWVSLKKIVIPSSVTSIIAIAFNYRMPNLEEIIIHKAQDSISGAPWGATNAKITWTG